MNGNEDYLTISIPRLSVVVPTYNRASYLSGCIQSLQNAGVPDIEIVVVDDGSQDDTRSVAEALQPRVIYLTQPNQGVSAARNYGLQVCRGRYVGYLDSDDYWLPGIAEKLLEFLDRYPEVGAVFANAQMGNEIDGYVPWFEAAGRHEFRQLPTCEVESGLKVLEPLPFYRLMLRRNCIFTGAILLRRDVVLEHGLFNPNLRVAEDWEVWLRMIHKVKFAYYDKFLAVYNKHEGTLTTDKDRMQQGYCNALRSHGLWAQERVPSERKYWCSALQHHLFSNAYHKYKQHRYAEARSLFLLSLSEGGWDTRAAKLWLACNLPGSVVRWLRSTFQKNDSTMMDI